MKQPAHTFKGVMFPECSKLCALVGYLGVGECESVCPWKFDSKGNSLEVFNIPSDVDIVVGRLTKEN